MAKVEANGDFGSAGGLTAQILHSKAQGRRHFAVHGCAP